MFKNERDKKNTKEDEINNNIIDKENIINNLTNNNNHLRKFPIIQNSKIDLLHEVCENKQNFNNYKIEDKSKL